MTISNAIDVVKKAQLCFACELSPAMARDVEGRTRVFDGHKISGQARDVNIFTFHLDVPESHRQINYVDVVHDHHAFDYETVAAHFETSVRRFNPSVGLYLVTDGRSRTLEGLSKNVERVTMPMDGRAPMLERVKAMLAYALSDAFDRDTAFLDTDAFPNADLTRAFVGDFDVGVTFRTSPEFMPLNEGVIFCRVKNRSAVQAFFRAYLATYEALMRDPDIEDYYGDIGRWRGGQLSLNAVAWSFTSATQAACAKLGVKVAFLPCDTFNFWVTDLSASAVAQWADKMVLHLKGDSKAFIRDFMVRRDLQPEPA